MTSLYPISSAEFRRAPYAILGRMREEAPVQHEASLDAYSVTRYADVLRLLASEECTSTRARRDARAVDTEARRALARAEDFLALWPVMSDGPAHARLRAPLARRMAACPMGRWESTITDLVDGWLARVVPLGVLDVVLDIAYPLVTWMTACLLGVPLPLLSKLSGWTGEVRRLIEGPHVSASAATAADAATLALVAFVREHRGKDPPKGFEPGLLQGAQELSDMELAALLSTILVTGSTAPAMQIVNAARLVLPRPELCAIATGDPSSSGRLVSECARYEGATMRAERRATRDIFLHGGRIPAGSFVLLWIAAANRDHRRFSDPDELLPDRAPSRHLGMGSGPHACIAAQLTRVMVTTVLRALARRGAQPICEEARLDFLPSTVFRGVRHFPVQLVS